MNASTCAIELRGRWTSRARLPILAPIVFAASIVFAACSPAVEFPVPPVAPDADESDRAAQYEDYQLSLTGNAFTGYRYTSSYAAAIWGRGSRTPERVDTSRIFARYEDTRRTRAASQGFALTAIGVSVVGGALIGVALGAEISDPHDTAFLPGPARIGVGVGGAGAMVLAFVFIGVSLAKYRQLGPLYNRDLRRDLGLTARAPHRARPHLVWSSGRVGLAW